MILIDGQDAEDGEGTRIRGPRLLKGAGRRISARSRLWTEPTIPCGNRPHVRPPGRTRTPSWAIFQAVEKLETGADVIISGFILGPDGLPNSKIVVRALGPSLVDAGVTGALQDPTLELHDSSGNLIASDDDWKDNSAQAVELETDGLAPTDDRESAIAASLAPGAFTAAATVRNRCKSP